MEAEVTNKMVSEAGNILELIRKGMESTGTFAMEQLPDVCAQLITYERAITSLWVLGALLLLGGAIRGIKTLNTLDTRHDAAHKDQDNYLKEKLESSLIMYAMGTLVVVIIGVWTLLLNIGPCLKVWFAPKVFLLEYLAQMIK